ANPAGSSYGCERTSVMGYECQEKAARQLTSVTKNKRDERDSGKKQNARVCGNSKKWCSPSMTCEKCLSSLKPKQHYSISVRKNLKLGRNARPMAAAVSERVIAGLPSLGRWQPISERNRHREVRISNLL